MLQSRLQRRLRELGLESFAEYHTRFFGDPEHQAAEIEHLLNLATTNKTDFFREPEHFAVLVREALPQWLRARRSEPFRVWCAGCSTGEEAYTIAMTLADCLPPGQGWAIVGTDISSRVLETARRGMYPIEAADKIPPQLLRDYCLRGRDEFDGFLAIDRVLRERVTFREANLLELPADLGSFDIVFLRNVMIYFGAETKRRIVGRVTSMLRPGGHLVVSHSETLNGIQDGRLRLVQPSVYELAEGSARNG